MARNWFWGGWRPWMIKEVLKYWSRIRCKVSMLTSCRYRVFPWGFGRVTWIGRKVPVLLFDEVDSKMGAFSHCLRVFDKVNYKRQKIVKLSAVNSFYWLNLNLNSNVLSNLKGEYTLICSIIPFVFYAIFQRFYSFLALWVARLNSSLKSGLKKHSSYPSHAIAWFASKWTTIHVKV